MKKQEVDQVEGSPASTSSPMNRPIPARIFLLAMDPVLRMRLMQTR
jgi:hypothetical protein